MAVPSTTSDVPEVSFQDESSDADDDCIDIKEEIFADSTEPELVEPCIEPGETAADNGFAWGHPHNFDENIVHPFQGPSNNGEDVAADEPLHEQEYESAGQVTGQVYPCSYCSRQFIRNSDLRVHVQAVHEGLRHPCDQCDKTYANRKGLRRHIRDIHEGGKLERNAFVAASRDTLLECMSFKVEVEDEGNVDKFVCDQCDKTYANRKGLRRHIRDIHEGGKQERNAFIAASRDSHIECMTFKVEVEDEENEDNFGQSVEITKCFSGTIVDPRKMSSFDEPAGDDDCSDMNPQSIHPEGLSNEELDLGEKVYSCILCSYQTSRPRNLVLHTQAIHERFACNYCDNTYAEERGLKRHIKHVHPDCEQFFLAANGHDEDISAESLDIKADPSELSHTTGSDMNVDPDKELPQELQPDEDPDQYPLNTHEDNADNASFCWDNHDTSSDNLTDMLSFEVKEESDPEALEAFNETYSAAPPPPLKSSRGGWGGGTVYTCSQCPFTTHNAKNLRAHRQSVHEGVRYPCPQCHKTFSDKSGRRRHLKSVHNGQRRAKVEQDLSCDECTFIGKTTSNLRRHKRIVHMGITFPCDQCSFVGAEPSKLKQHRESVHERVRHPCDQCDFTASRSDKLKLHKRIKHEQVGVRYKCDQCDFTAIRPDKLTQHRKNKHAPQHEPHPESLFSFAPSDFTLPLPEILDQDMKYENAPGVVRYPCDQCDYIASRPDKLKRHKKCKHEQGGVRYPCDQCDFTASRSDNLNQHKKNKHARTALNNTIKIEK